MRLINVLFTAANQISMQTENPVENSGSLAADSSAANSGSAANSSSVAAGGSADKGGSEAKMGSSRPKWWPPGQYCMLWTTILAVASVSVCACAYTDADQCLVSTVQHLKITVKSLGWKDSLMPVFLISRGCIFTRVFSRRPRTRAMETGSAEGHNSCC